MKVTEIAYHRNGISGEPFYACKFEDPEQGEMVGVVFPPGNFPNEPLPDGFHNPRVAVFKLEKLAEGSIAFGENSWRGDNYADALYAAIGQHDILAERI